MYHNDIRPLLPKEHPLWQPREKIPSETPPAETLPVTSESTPREGELEIVEHSLDEYIDIVSDNSEEPEWWSP
jgi:hypothetical protein